MTIDVTMVDTGEMILLADASIRARAWLQYSGMGWLANAQASALERPMATALAAELMEAGLAVRLERAH